MWDKARVHALLDSNPTAVWRAVYAIYQRQTADEQATKSTTKSNGVGFASNDAEFLSDLAVKWKRGWRMSDKQLAVARNRIKRYHRQLCEIANDADAKKAGVSLGASPARDAAAADVGNVEEARNADFEVAAAARALLARGLVGAGDHI